MLTKRALKRRIKINVVGLLFASPWIIGFLVFGLIPILQSAYYGFTDFNIFTKPNWVGLDNYKDLFSDPMYIKSIYNTLFMVVVGTPVYIIIGLITAMLLNMNVRGKSFYRTVYYIPSIVPTVASSLLWLWLLNSQYGLIDSVLGELGLFQPNWLTNPLFTKPALILMGSWSTGTIMIIFLAALQNIPAQLYEVAEIDGANAWDKFWHVTMPGISPIMLYQIILSIIANFQYFTQVYIMTGTGSGTYTGTLGGPDNSMLFYALYIFKTAFSYLKMGKACAMAWILFLIVALVTWLLVKTSKSWVDYGEGGDNG